MSTIIATDQPTNAEVLVLGIAKEISGNAKIRIQSAGYKVAAERLENRF